MRRLLLLGAALVPFVFSAPANAQMGAQIVQTCGSPPNPLSPGPSAPLTQDTTGTLCTKGGGTGAVYNAQVQPQTLMTGANSAGPITPTSPGGETIGFPSAFNGATITLTSTGANGVTSTIGSYTSAQASPLNLSIPAGATVTATATGGTPTGNTVIAYNPSAGVGGGGGSITGNVGGYSAQVADLMTVSTNSHAAGSSIGGLQTVSLARTPGGSGTLTNVRVRSTSGATPTLWVYAWSKQPSSTCTDGSAFSGNSADAPYAIPGFPQAVTLTSPGSWDTSSYAQLLGVNAQFKNQDATPGTSIYLCFVLSGAAVTPASASDFSAVVDGLQD